MTSFLKGLLAVAAGAGEGAAIGRIDELKAKAEEEKMKRLAELNDLYAQKREGRAATREDIVRKDERGYKEGLLQEQRDYQTFTRSETEKAARESAAAKEETDIRKTESERRYKEETGGIAFQSFTDHIKIFEKAGFKNSKELAIKAFNAKTDAAKRKNYADFYTAYTKLQADSGLLPDQIHKDAVEWAGIAAGITPEAGPSQPITKLTGEAAKKRGAELIADIRAGKVNPAQLSARLQESGQTEVWRIIAEDARANKAKPKPSPILEPSEVQTKETAPFSSVTGKETEALGGGAKPTKRTGPPRKSLLTDIKEGVKEYHKPSGPGERREKMEALSKRTGLKMDTILYFIDKFGDKILDMSTSEIKELLEKDQP